MGQVRSGPHDALLCVAAFSRFPELLDRVPTLLEAFGPVALVSPRFAFTETDYYAGSMGIDLEKQLFAFRDLVPADRLADIKLRTNAMEERIAAERTYDVARPLNLDPGLLDAGKLVLASTKDHAHRVYIGRGIFAEVTLHFRNHDWRPWPWTYPDYLRAETLGFLHEARRYFRERQSRVKS